jgi:hypothetical protein
VPCRIGTLRLPLHSCGELIGHTGNFEQRKSEIGRDHAQPRCRQGRTRRFHCNALGRVYRDAYNTLRVNPLTLFGG